MKNKLTQSVNAFLTVVLSVSVLIPSLSYANFQAVNDVQTVFERTSIQDFGASFQQTEATKTTNNIDGTACIPAARKGRCTKPIQYKSTILGKAGVGTSECTWSARKGRCNRAIQYKSDSKLQMAGANSACEWSARKGRCKQSVRYTSTPKLKIATNKSGCKWSARKGRCNQPITYSSSLPEFKVANSQCQWSARSGRCAKPTESSGNPSKTDKTDVIFLSTSGQCEWSARKGRCNQVNLPTNHRAKGQATIGTAAN